MNDLVKGTDVSFLILHSEKCKFHLSELWCIDYNKVRLAAGCQLRNFNLIFHLIHGRMHRGKYFFYIAVNCIGLEHVQRNFEILV